MSCVRGKFGGFWSQGQSLYCPLAHWFLDHISHPLLSSVASVLFSRWKHDSVLQDQSWVAPSCLPHCHQKNPLMSDSDSSIALGSCGPGYRVALSLIDTIYDIIHPFLALEKPGKCSGS